MTCKQCDSELTPWGICIPCGERAFAEGASDDSCQDPRCTIVGVKTVHEGQRLCHNCIARRKVLQCLNM